MVTFPMLPRQISLLNPPNSFTPILLQTLGRPQNTQLLWNQANPDSLTKTGGAGVPLRDSAHSAAQRYPFPAVRVFNNIQIPLHASEHSHPLFSFTYKLPSPYHRFSSSLFSWTYKSLFSQLLSFHINTNCRGWHPLAKTASFKMGIPKKCRVGTLRSRRN